MVSEIPRLTSNAKLSIEQLALFDLFLSLLALFSLLLVLLVTDSALAQKKRGRGRKGKNGADQCHQKEVVKCFDKLTALGKEDDPTSIIATSQGLNRICK